MPGEISASTETKNREFVNLVDKIPDDKQAEIATQIIADYNDDDDAREDWKEKRNRWYKLWTLARDPKTDPWPGASNVCIPLLSTAINQFHGRAYQSIFSAPRLMRAFPVAKNDIRRAQNVENYLNWQLSYEMDEYEEVFDKLLLNLPINGIAFKKLMYSKPFERPVSDYISALDLVLPYRTKSLETAQRITHRLWLNWDELLDRDEQGLYANFDKLSSNPSISDEESESLRQTADQTVGVTSLKRDIKPHLILERHSKWDLGDGRKPYIFTVDRDTSTLLRVVSRNFKAGATTKTLDFFVDYHFLPNSEGFYSYGYGHFLEVLNEMANTAFNQIFDAGSLSNKPFFFYGKRAGFKSREIRLKPGAGFEVEDASQVVFPQIQRLDSVLFQVLGLITNYVSGFTSVTENVLGREQKGVERPTARGTLALIEQGLTTFAIIVKRTRRAMKKELRLIRTMNEIFLPDSKEFRVSGAADKIAFSDIKREDFGGVQDVVPIMDPSFASKQVRRQEALQVYQLMLANPLVVGTPPPKDGGQPAIPPNPRAIWEVTSDLLDEFEVQNRNNILPDLPEESIPPGDENALFMQGDTKNPLPQEDHLIHLAVHSDFRLTEAYKKMPQKYKDLLDEHVLATQQLLSLQQLQPPALPGVNAGVNVPGGPVGGGVTGGAIQ
jgi:hypothetical protein